MKKYVYFRINDMFIDVVQKNIPSAFRNNNNTILVLPTNDMQIQLIYKLNKQLDDNLYYDWDLFYEYTDEELTNADLFRVKYPITIDSCGEEGGTRYDYSTACPICGAGRQQMGDLHLSSKLSLKKNTIYKTIGGEIIVPYTFCNMAKEQNLHGMDFLPVWMGDCKSTDFFQLTTTYRLEVSSKTRFGIDFFDTDNISSMSGKTFNIGGQIIYFPKEIYVCPNRDLVGLRLLSELFVIPNKTSSTQVDYMKTAQYIGVKRGFLNPEPLYICSKKAYNALKKMNLKGIVFEIVRQ